MNRGEDCSEATLPVASFLAITGSLLLQGGPAGDLEQIDSYLEALLKEDNLLGNTK